MAKINLDEVRLSQDFASNSGIKPVLIRVPVGRPGKTTFVRVHPDEEYSLDVFILELDGEDDYLLAPVAAEIIPELAKPVRLFTYVTRPGNVGLWPVKLPTEEGRTNSWSQSAMECALLARENWVRLSSSRELGSYMPYVATGITTDPKWPEKTFDELIEIAFRDRYIDSAEHPVIIELLGNS